MASVTSNLDSSGSSESESDEVPPKSISGFYYDKKKKKYFKIQSQGFNAESCLTNDSIKKKKVQKKVSKLMQNVQKRKPNTKKSVDGKNLLQLHQQFQTSGKVSSDRLRNFSLKFLRPKFWAPTIASGKVLSSVRMSDGYLMYRTRTPDMHLVESCISTLNIHHTAPGAESVEQHRYHTGTGKRSAVTADYMTELQPGLVLVAENANTSCHTYNLLIWKRMTDGQNLVKMMTNKFVGGYSLCHVASMADNESFLVAETDSNPSLTTFVRHMNVNHYGPQTLRRIGTIGRSQIAPHYLNSNLAYVGSRSGQIMMMDLRVAKSNNVLCQFKSPTEKYIYSVLSLQDDYSLVTSHINGLKCLFDTRLQKVIARNEEFVTEASCDTCELKADESRKYISASGQKGGFMRVWDSRSLETRHVIKFPTYVRDNYQCELSTLNGHLNIFTIDDKRLTLHLCR